MPTDLFNTPMDELIKRAQDPYQQNNAAMTQEQSGTQPTSSAQQDIFSTPIEKLVTAEKPTTVAPAPDAAVPSDYQNPNAAHSFVNSMIQGGASTVDTLSFSVAISQEKKDNNTFSFVDKINKDIPAPQTTMSLEDADVFLSNNPSAKKQWKGILKEYYKNFAASPGQEGSKDAFTIDVGTVTQRPSARPPSWVKQFVFSSAQDRVKMLEELKIPAADRAAAKWGDEFSKDVAASFPVDQKRQQEFLTGRLPNALGGLIVDVGASIATLGAAAVPVATSEAKVSQYLDALDHGATQDDALKAADFGEAAGLLELVPAFKVLRRFDKATGGAINKYISKIAIGGLEELSQETASNIVRNIIASDVVKYDEQRGIFTGTGDNADVSFSVGALNTALSLFLGHKVRKMKEDNADFKARVEQESNQIVQDQKALEAQRQESSAAVFGQNGEGQLTAGQIQAGNTVDLRGEASINEQLAKEGALGPKLKDLAAKSDQVQANKVRQYTNDLLSKNLDNYDPAKPVVDMAGDIQTGIEVEAETARKKYIAAYEKAAQTGNAKLTKDNFTGVYNNLVKDTKITDAQIAEKPAALQEVLSELKTASEPLKSTEGYAVGKPTISLEKVLEWETKLNSLVGTKDAWLAGKVRGVIDNVVLSSDNFIGDKNAAPLIQAAKKARREYGIKFEKQPGEKANIIASILNTGKDVTPEEVSAMLFGKGQGKLRDSTGASMRKIKTTFGADSGIYKTAQAALANKIFERLGASGESRDVPLGEFDYTKYTQNYNKLVEQSGSVLKENLPQEMLVGLEHLHTVAEAIAMEQGNKKGAIGPDDLGALEDWFIRTDPGSTAYQGLRLGSTLSTIASRTLALVGIKRLVLGNRVSGAEAAFKAPKQAIEAARPADRKRLIDVVTYENKLKDKFGKEAAIPPAQQGKTKAEPLASAALLGTAGSRQEDKKKENQ